MCLVPPEAPDPREEERQLERRKRYSLEGQYKGYPLLNDVHDRRIFKTPSPVKNLLPINLKHLTIAELRKAVSPKYYED